jgi:HSP20 family protein
MRGAPSADVSASPVGLEVAVFRSRSVLGRRRGDVVREPLPGQTLTQQVVGTNGTLARPAVMPMDAWRDGDTFHVEFDLPGVNPDSIDLDVERNVVTVKAERPARDGDAELVAAERPRGVFSRQLILGDNLDTEHIEASYDTGVLTLLIPVAEQAKPRKIAITSKDEDRQAINA